MEYESRSTPYSRHFEILHLGDQNENITMNHVDTLDENPGYSQFSMHIMNDII